MEVPRAQTCCGQPAYNSGDRATARVLARDVLEAFGGYDYVVVPSGSCGGMLRHHLPALFDDDPNLKARAAALAGRTYELVQFLRDLLHVEHVPARFEASVTYHDSCAGLRELGIKQQPRDLLRGVEGLTLRELPDAEVCCGFGGTFCVKYPEISTRMASDKATDIQATGADTVLAGDLGCLLNIAGRLKREGSAVHVRHIAEVLAGMAELGAADRRRPRIGVIFSSPRNPLLSCSVEARCGARRANPRPGMRHEEHERSIPAFPAGHLQC